MSELENVDAAIVATRLCEIYDYVLWYARSERSGVMQRRYGEVLAIEGERIVVVERRGRLTTVEVGDVAARARSLSELEAKLDELRESHPTEDVIRQQLAELMRGKR